MAPIVIDAASDTTIFVVQADGQKIVKRVELRVLAAALEQNSYWKKFVVHMRTNVGLRASNVHTEDTGISATAIEIAIRALHMDYHANTKKSVASHQDESVGQDGEADKGKQQNTATGSSGKDGSATTDWKEMDQALAELDKKMTSRSQGFVDTTGIRGQSAELDANFPKTLFEVPVDDVWAVLPLINFRTCGVHHQGKLDIDGKLLLPWFLKWRQVNFPKFKEQHDFECVLFPTFALNDAQGWSYATKWLCHNTSRGRISEYSPLVFRSDVAFEWYSNLHLPKEVIARIRVARSQIYARLEEDVWHLTRNVWFAKHATCACRVVAAYNYRKALQDAGALEMKTIRGKQGGDDKVVYSDRLNQNKTVAELVECLGKVVYEKPLDSCFSCSDFWVSARLSKAGKVAMNFQGLCLDCMEASLDEDKSIPDLKVLQRFDTYKYKIDRDSDLCLCCRIRHGRTSWYFSWVNPTPRQLVFPPPKGGDGRRDPFGL